VLVNYFSQQGWEFPPAALQPGSRGRMTRKQIEQHPEVRRVTREANRIIRLVDKKLTTKGK
jgi:hypothetical protein